VTEEDSLQYFQLTGDPMVFTLQSVAIRMFGLPIKAFIIDAIVEAKHQFLPVQFY